MKKEEFKLKNDNFIDALNNAINGLKFTIKTQKNIRAQLLICVFVLAFSLFFNLTNIEFIILIFSILFVLFAETINTAVESVVDLVTEKYEYKAKIAKDVAAGAVIISAINSICVGIVLFITKININSMKEAIYNNIINKPIYTIFILLLIGIIISILILTNNKEKGKN